jgi:Holliday junction resolvasome RuvABC ATP-dependent DNA helicase subunit
MNEAERSDRKVTVRFSEDEFNKLTLRKATTRAKDLSAFIRDVCLQKPLLMKTQLDTYQDEALSLLVEMRADLLRVGININQSARRINSVTNYHDLQRDVNEMVTNVGHLSDQLQLLINTLSLEAQPAYQTPHGYSNQ